MAEEVNGPEEAPSEGTPSENLPLEQESSGETSSQWARHKVDRYSDGSRKDSAGTALRKQKNEANFLKEKASYADKMRKAPLELASKNETVKSVADDLQRAQKIAKNVNRITKSTFNLIKPLFSPQVLIPAIVAFICMLIIFMILAASQVIGHNDNVDGCLTSDSSNSGGGGVSVGQIQKTGSGVNLQSAENVVGSWLMSYNFKFLGGKPMTKEQAAGVIGNMVQESGVNPYATQGNWISSDATTAQVRAAGESSGGRAIGLVQWDSSRKKDLLDYADKQGKPWNDVTVQLGFFGQELEGYYGDMLKKSNFVQPGLSVNDYTLTWTTVYEGAGDPQEQNRYKGAADFMASYNGASGSTVPTGGSCLMDGGSVDASSVVAFAISIAYPPDQQSLAHVTPDDINGVNEAPPAYKAAKARAEKIGGPDGIPDLYASCDRFAATVYKNTLDPNIPWGSTTEQFAYLSGHPNLYKEYHTKAEAKPGDIWITITNGHIVLYIGNYKGVDSIASGSYHQRVGDISASTYLSPSLVDTEGRQYAGFHYIGPNAQSGAAAATSLAAAPTTATKK